MQLIPVMFLYIYEGAVEGNRCWNQTRAEKRA